MMSLQPWLLPRIAFWTLWTAWLWCLQAFLLDTVSGYAAQLLILGPPLLATWIGSRLAKNEFESPSSLFWKGASVCALLTVFANVFLLREMEPGIALLIPVFLGSAVLGLRGTGTKRYDIKQGDLYERVQGIARLTGVSMGRVVVYTSQRNKPGAFANRMGGVVLSDRLLAILSRRETDAVIAHEAAHLRPAQRMTLAVMPIGVSVAILTGSFWPELKVTAPFWPFAALLIWKAVRRFQEFDADGHSILVNRDPESLITALTRVSREGGLPLHWGNVAGIFMSHPPMTARFRAIARKAGIGQARIDELVSVAQKVPPLPGYNVSLGPHPQADGALSKHSADVAKMAAMLFWVLPIVIGVASSASWLFSADPTALDAGLLPGRIIGWSLSGVLCYWIAYEVLIGMERGRIRGQLAASRQGGYFAGLSTAAEPRDYGNAYHYDLGMVRTDGPLLTFSGTHCGFALGPSQVRRTWIANGPPHWTPRKVVCVEYQFGSGSEGAVLSLQPLDRWFWPFTTIAAKQLRAAIKRWSESAPQEALSSVPPPLAKGMAIKAVPLAAVLKQVRLFAAISLALSWLINNLLPLNPQDMWTAFSAPVVTTAIILFVLSPHWLLTKAPPALPSSPSPFPETE